MFFTGKNPVIHYPFPEILINLPCLSYISLRHSALHFSCDSPFAGSFKIPFTPLHVPQPMTALRKLSPGIVFYNLIQHLIYNNLINREKQNIRHT